MNRKKMRMGMMVGVFIFLLIPVLALGTYPDREITVYCGSSAGGVTDLGIRLLSETVSKTLGQPVVVTNKPGASHTICANLVANAKPDGSRSEPYPPVPSPRFLTCAKFPMTLKRTLPGLPPTRIILLAWWSERMRPGKPWRSSWIIPRKIQVR